MSRPHLSASAATLPAPHAFENLIDCCEKDCCEQRKLGRAVNARNLLQLNVKRCGLLRRISATPGQARQYRQSHFSQM